MPLLAIENLHVSVDQTPVLNGISVQINPGELHVLMGPNGSGKSSLAHVLAGHPAYTVMGGRVTFGTDDLATMKPEERSRRGLFLAFQQPIEVSGVLVRNLLRTSVNAIRSGRGDQPLSIRTLRRAAQEAFEAVGLPLSFLDRSVNEHFSGGEKKRFEMAQLLLLQPKLAILDETDSGLDVDAIRSIGEALARYRERQGADNTGEVACRDSSQVTGAPALLIITHYPRLLRWIKPSHVHLLVAGKIVQSDGAELADRVERDGYAWLTGSNV